MTEERKNKLFLRSFQVGLKKPATEAQKKQAVRDLEKIGELLDDPEYIIGKPMALTVCKMLIGLSLEGGMARDSIGHKLSMRLYDYIGRVG